MNYQVPHFTNLIQLVSDHINRLFQESLPAYRYFHNFKHALSVAEKCRVLSHHYRLPEPEAQAVILAGWFHDTGYIFGSSGHEEHSVEIARLFLKNHISDHRFLVEVESHILVTRLPSKPISRSQEIICDADLYHLGSASFPEQTTFLKMEISSEKGIDISNEAWRKENISFLSLHQYFTRYARDHWGQQKEKNLLLLKNS